MKARISLWVLGCCFAVGAYGQKASKADQYFFEYDFRQAISAYEEESRKAPLTPVQKLNLAEAYFKVRQYDKAADQFVRAYREDSVMTNNHFNTMLQALSKTSAPERVQAFLNTRSAELSDELLENATFNEELLEGQGAGDEAFRMFALDCNSGQADFAPAFYGDDRILFSTSRPQEGKDTYFPTGEAYTDIYVGRVSPDGQVRNAEPLNSLPPLKFHEATPFYSEQLNGILYVRSNSEDGILTYDANGKNSLTLALSRPNGQFSLLLRDPSISFYYPYFDADNERLYFAADFPQGYGGTDLYYVVTNKGQIMSAPVNLGPRINTPGNEIGPYIVGNNLYFSSDIFYGLGGMDIYKSELHDDGTFSIPANLGRGINTSQDEFGFVIRQDGEAYKGYFTSNRNGGKGADDLYGFTVSELPGLKTLIFRGDVVDGSAFGIDKARVRLTDSSDGVIKETYTREDGTFHLEIPWREDVRIRVDKDRYTSVDLGATADSISLASGAPLRVVLKDIGEVVRENQGRTLLKCDRYFFNRGSSRLNDEIRRILEQPLQALREFPELRIRVEAHTDSRGNADTNLNLSRERARAIRDYFVSNGIDPGRIVDAQGYGESQLTNHCEDGVYCIEVLHRQNERYPLVVVNFNEL